MNGGHHDLVIQKLDRAKQALSEAKTIQATKQILDIAGAAEIYARRQKLGKEAIEYASVIRIQALRHLGELLKVMPKNTGAKGIGKSAVPKENHTPATLADLGIDKKTSMIAQKFAGLPQAQFEQVRDGTATLTQVMRERANPNNITWSLESVEQDLRKAINHTIVGAPPGSQQRIADLLRMLAEELDEAAQPELRESAWIARDELELHDAEPGGFRVFENEHEASTHPGAPTVVASCKSTHQPWYRDLTTRRPGVTALKRKQVEARLDDIDKGKLATARTAQTHIAVMWAIKDLSRTSSLGRGVR